MMTLSFEMSDEKTQIYREYESLFDALGQVGGLEAILLSIFGFLVDPLSKGKYESFLIKKLYKKAKTVAHDQNSDLIEPTCLDDCMRCLL